MSINDKNRVLWIDYLKFIALIGLVISHVFTNPVLIQIRSFDVNLLVILSATLSQDSFKDNRYFSYYKKRLIRLVLPTWLFISIYIVLNYIFRFQKLTLIKVVRSYFFQDSSIGYVWIIYVYLICAIMLPHLSKLDFSNRKTRLLFYFSIVLYIGLYHISDNYYYRVLVLYPLIYGIISYIGIIWWKIKKCYKYSVISLLLLSYGCYAIYLFKLTGEYVTTALYKYPPQMYYLCYSIGVSCLLVDIFSRISFKNNITSKFVVFVSKHSLWFYLWHILTLQISYRITVISWLRFFIVFGLATVFVYIQDIIVKKLKEKGCSNLFVSILNG